jgi:hypothetical protein
MEEFDLNEHDKILFKNTFDDDWNESKLEGRIFNLSNGP